MGRMAAVVFVLGLLVVGRNRLVRQLNRIERERQFALEFGGKLTAYAESDGADENAYTWLMHRSPKMGAQLGVRIAYQRPFSRGPVVVVPVVDLVTEVRHFLNDRHDKEVFGTARRVGEIIINNLLRHVGELDDERDNVLEEFNNPIVWFREGVRALLNVPFVVLAALGLLSVEGVRRVNRNPVWSFVTAVASVIAFTGALAETVTGWPAISRVLGTVAGLVSHEGSALTPAQPATPAATDQPVASASAVPTPVMQTPTVTNALSSTPVEAPTVSPARLPRRLRE